jgi:hypothetical protein
MVIAGCSILLLYFFVLLELKIYHLACFVPDTRTGLQRQPWLAAIFERSHIGWLDCFG